jgi:23S rRNA (pseudouridine1915-N3)-methyltransferase
MTEESRVLLETVPPLAQLWVLDERGPPMSTAALAAELRKAIDGGLQNLAFAVGGPDGHAGIVRDRARRIISFGEMTWPHRLVRVMLAEQLYRSFTIMTGHPYHRAQH